MIRSRIPVNQWLQHLPSVEEVRPPLCVACGAASRPAGGGLVLHGHGLRPRQLRGPTAVRAPPSLREVLARRYQCQRCVAILLVVPCEIAPRRHYAATAIALALALYGALGQSQAQVRSVISSDGTLGLCATYRWRTLSRWIDAAAARALFIALPAMPITGNRRAIAQRAAMAIGAHAPPSLPEGAPEVRAFAGAAHMP